MGKKIEFLKPGAIKVKKLFALFLFLFLLPPFVIYGQINFEKYNAGYYINNDNQKITGIIRYVKGNNARIDYKETEGAKRKKIYPDECKEFGFDSSIRFIKCPRVITVKIGVWNYDIQSDFIRVFEEGKISLYKHYAMLGSSTMGGPPDDIENIIIKKEGSDTFEPLPPNRKKAKARLKELFPDEPAVVEMLSENKWEECLEFVREYNSR